MKTRILSCVLFVCSVQFASAIIDVNSNGMSDVWEMLYGVSGLTTNGDANSDGFSNGKAAIAGTNPLDSNSVPRLRIGFQAGTGTLFNWDSFPGKRYTLQSKSGVTGGPWTNETQVIATGALSQTNLNLNVSAKFFRLSIDDVDSDNDGITDYEELALGFNPTTQHTDRYDQTDSARILGGFNAANTITISALDPMMFQLWPDPGLVAIRRSGGLRPITVNFSLGGSAAPGVDYTLNATNSITIPPGVREVWLQLQPNPNSSISSPQTISVTLIAGTNYSIGSPAVANLTLTNETTNSLPNPKSAARFLIQAAFGPDLAPTNGLPPNVAEVMALGFNGWINDQLTRPIGYVQPWVDWAVTNGNALQIYGDLQEYSWWGRAMGTPTLRPDWPTNQLPDPLRQRVAFALSEILVVSDRPEDLSVVPQGVANYYDLMLKHAFGNYRNLLYDVATHPAMGMFLSSIGNQKAIVASNIFPDENFAREIMQLFTIGLWQLNPDGTQLLDGNGQPIPTYDNSQITELARVFTGLSFGNNSQFMLYPRDFTVPMKCWDAYHDCDTKTLIGGLHLPARTPSPGNTGTAGLADVDAAVSNLFAHPNTGPFIGKQLIQRLVTSNPSTNYVARVAAAFADNGSGVRGDMQAVIKAILLDPEARDPAMMSQPAFGKLREPFLRCVNLARAFNAASASGYYMVEEFSLDHLQDPMDAPSVFNFFLPSYTPPGVMTQMGLVSPELQIVNASTAITGPNYFWNAILGDLNHYGSGNPNYSVHLNLTNELSMIVPAAQVTNNVPAGPAADPDPLLRRLDLALTGGTLSPQQFQIIREAMLRINTSTWQWHQERLRLAIYLIVTSPEFNVMR